MFSLPPSLTAREGRGAPYYGMLAAFSRSMQPDTVVVRFATPRFAGVRVPQLPAIGGTRILHSVDHSLIIATPDGAHPNILAADEALPGYLDLVQPYLPRDALESLLDDGARCLFGTVHVNVTPKSVPGCTLFSMLDCLLIDR